MHILLWTNLLFHLFFFFHHRFKGRWITSSDLIRTHLAISSLSALHVLVFISLFTNKQQDLNKNFFSDVGAIDPLRQCLKEDEIVYKAANDDMKDAILIHLKAFLGHSRQKTTEDIFSWEFIKVGIFRHLQPFFRIRTSFHFYFRVRRLLSPFQSTLIHISK